MAAKRFFVFLLLPILFFTNVARADETEIIQVIPENSQKPAEAVADELIIKYKDDVNAFEKRQFKEANELETERVKRNPLKEENIEKVQLEEAVTTKELEAIIEELEDHPAVEYAEPNYMMSLQSVTPNDTEFARQWALPKIQAPDAWETSTGSPEVVVAILDTGLDLSHPDKPLNLIPGYDFVNDDTDPQDDHGHGTYMAGVIAANSNNSQGIAGICWQCSVMPVKVMDSRGMGTYSTVSAGIMWAADHGANVINLSIGGYAYSQALQDAVSYAQNKGVLVISAAGNQGSSDMLYPASYPDVIAVSATDSEDRRWTRSNYGGFIDLAAPGVDVYGLGLANSYRNQTGTSVSAAHVTGVAGLLLSVQPDLSSSLLTQKLYNTAEDLGDSGKDPYFGWGRVELLVPVEQSFQDIVDTSNPELTIREAINLPGGPGFSDNYPESDENKKNINQNDCSIENNVGSASHDHEEKIDKNNCTNNNELRHNIIITDIKVSSFNFQLGETISIIVYGQNQGQAEAENVLLRVFVNDVSLGIDKKIPVLEPGNSLPVEFSWTPTVEFNRQTKLLIRAEIDSIAGEINIGDNVRALNLSANNDDGMVTIQYDTDVHEYLTEQGVHYLNTGSINSAAYKELKNYIPQLRQGAKDEDAIGYFGGPLADFGILDAPWRPLRHFYRPLDKQGYFDGDGFNTATKHSWVFGFSHVLDNKRYPNSYQWAVNQKLDPNDLDNNHTFQEAVNEYKKGNKATAYQILGHVLHLVEDASVPEHTQLESHPDIVLDLDGDPGAGYEQYVGLQYNSDDVWRNVGLNRLLYPDCDADPRGCLDNGFYSANQKKSFSYYQEEIKKFDSLEDFFDSMASLSYYRNRFKGDLNNPAGQRGQLETMFPDLKWNDTDKIWEIDGVGKWHDRTDGVHLDDEFWETQQFDSNTQEDPDWYYIEASYKGANGDIVRPYRIEADWYGYALAEMKKPRDQRFTTPYSGPYVDNDPGNGKILAEVFAEDLIPLSVQHVAGVMDLFWRETHQDPDLVFMPDTLHGGQNVSLDNSFIHYTLSVKVKNEGTGMAKTATACFQPASSNDCLSQVNLANWAAGETRTINLSMPRRVLDGFYGDPAGELKILNVTNNDLKVIPHNNPLAVSQSIFEVGGVDMTFAEMGGIKVDPTSNQIRFILRGTEAQAGDAVIDLSATTANLTKIFLQALAIPNNKHYISLDIIPDGDHLVGRARVPTPFEQTDVADAFLKADVGMKFDLFGGGQLDGKTPWTDLVKASPYWSELSGKGFNRYPDWIIAATIVPGQIQARQTGNDFFLEDVAVDINAGWWMREPMVNLDGLGLSANARADLASRLATYKQTLENAVKNRALSFTIPQLNSAEPADQRFKGLRAIYAAIAAAQWYKEQVKTNPDLPYAYLIDSEDLTGIGMDTPFDKAYWDAQAYQNLGTFPCTTFGGQATCSARGGASLENSAPQIAGTLTDTQDSILEQALNGEVVQTDTASYLPGGTILAAAPDLELPSLTPDADVYLKGSLITFSLKLLNSGPLDAQNILLKLQDEVIAHDGTKVSYAITEQAIDALAAWEGIEIPFSWTLPDQTGTHVISALADPNDAIREMNEMNNVTQTVLTVADPKPLITIIAPDAGRVLHPDNITFEAEALDPLTDDFITNNSSFTWSSSLSGLLGNGASLTIPSLETGDHQITLTVMGPHGVSDSKTFNLYIRPLGSPLPRIRFPLEGGRLSQELTHTLTGEAVDNEDGALTGNSLTWTSNIDGDLGLGTQISKKLSLGIHALTLTATDSDGQTSSSTINVTVEKGAPELVIASPADNAVITEGDPIIFEASAADPQEGDISPRIIWSSDQEGLLDQNSEFSKTLEVGTHRITVTITDSDGLTVSEERTITVQNTPPVAAITAPAENTQINFGDSVTLEGNAADLQDGVLAPTALAWSSDRDGYLGTGASLAINMLSPGWHVITLTATDRGNAVGTATFHLNVYAGIPTINILRPARNQTFLEGIPMTLEAIAQDEEDGLLVNEAVTWTSSISGTLGTGNLITAILPVGAHTIRAETQDSDGWKASAEIAITVVPRQAPSVSILFPREGTSFQQGKKIYFYSRVADPEDGALLPESLIWSSDRDGALGQGPSLTNETLSVGSHTLTLTATDSDGMQSASVVHIAITPLPPVITITSPASGAVIKMGDPVTLEGNGADNLSWNSGLSGNLGSGPSFTLNDLPLGVHLITLTGTDVNGMEGQATTVITVVDEKNFNLNQFADSKTVQVLDFTAAQDYTLNIALPQEAVVDNAQVTLHPQRGLDDGTQVQTQFLTTQFEEETTSILEQPTDMETDTENEVRPIQSSLDPVLMPISTITAPKKNMEQKNPPESLNIMSGLPTLIDHHMTGSGDPDNAPPKSEFYLGDRFGSWISLANVSPGTEVTWNFEMRGMSFGCGAYSIPSSDIKPDGTWQEICFSSVANYDPINRTGGILSGTWQTNVSLRPIDQPSIYIFTDYFNVHESPNLTPEITIGHLPVTVFDHDSINISIDGVDNGSVTELNLYWNDGNGWENIEKTTEEFTSKEYTWYSKMYFGNREEIGSFPENTVVQYYATATDFDGNFAQTPTQSFTVLDSDTEGPAVSNLAIEEGAGADRDGFIDETENIAISWNLSDQSGIQNVQLIVDGEPQTVTLENGVYRVSLPPFARGDYAYTLIATDNDNSPATTTLSDTFTVVPRPLLLNPSMDSGADGTLEWNYAGEMVQDEVTPNFADSINTWIQTHIAGPDGTIAIPLLFHADGGNVLRVDNLNIAYRIIDITPPVISGVSINPTIPEAGQPFTLAVTAMDSTGIEEVTASLGDGSPVSLASQDATTFSATFTASAAGSYMLTITAKDKTGLTTVQTVAVTVVFHGPELAIAGIALAPADALVSGQTAEAIVTVQNTGDTEAEVQVVLQAFGLAAPIQSQDFLIVPAQGSALLTVSFILPEPGDHLLSVNVDPNGLIAEGNEENNTFTQNYTVIDGTPPVLTADNISSIVGAGQPFALMVTATDDMGVDSVFADFAGSQYVLTPDQDNRYMAIVTAPGTLGAQTLLLTARDSAGLTTTLQKTLTVIDPRPNPFVTVQDITLSSDNILARDLPEFRINLRNNGGSDVRVPVEIALDGEVKNTQTVTLAASQSFSLTWTGWEATAGAHTLKITLDPQNIIVEEDESDNAASYVFRVPYTLPPQLSNLNVPQNTLANGPFTISVDVLGDQELESVTIDLNGEIQNMNLQSANRYAFSSALPSGSYPFTLAAVNVSNLIARLPGTLIVHPALPDIAVSVPRITPLVLTNRDTASFTLTVRNDGFLPIADTEVILSLDDQPFHEETVTLSAGSQTELTPPTWPATPGLHTLTLTTDPENTLEEIDESNNTSSLTFRVGNVIPPSITSVTAKDTLYAGELFTLEAVITDQVAFTAAATLDGQETPLTFDQTSGVFAATLAAPSTPEDYTLILTAQNRDGLIARWERMVTVRDGRPDLSLSLADITITPRSLSEGTPETLSTTFRNYGGTDVSNAPVAFYVDGSLISITQLAISRGDQATAEWAWDPVFGAHDLVIRIDPENQVDESNEENNEYRVSFYVADVTPPSAPMPQAEVRVQSGEWSEERNWRVQWQPVVEQNLKTYAWQTDGGPFTETLVTVVDVAFEQADLHQACVRAEDLAGNLSPLGCTAIALDFAAPEASVLSGGTNGRFSSENQRAVSWTTPTDDGSGPDYYLIRINGEITTLANANSYEREWADGEYHVQVAAVDQAGHQGPWSNEITLLIDTTTPSAVSSLASSTHPDQSQWYIESAPQLTWQAPDDLSGIWGYYVYIDQNPATALTSQYPWIADTSYAVPEDEQLASGVWYFHVAAVDEAGNFGQTSHFKMQIDFNPPFTEVELPPSSRKAILTASDGWTAVVSTHYSLDGGPWQTGNEFDVSRGEHTVTYYSIDTLGNQEAMKETTFDQQYSPGSSRPSHRYYEEEEEGGEETDMTGSGQLAGEEKEEESKPAAIVPLEHDSFSRVTIHGRGHEAIISWNNPNTAIQRFSVYRYLCSDDATDCSQRSKVATVLAAPHKRMRMIDEKRPEQTFYYRIIGYGRKGKLIEKSLPFSSQ